jgi:hypothetical protein
MLRVTQEGDHVVLVNTQHQVPYRLLLPVRGEFAFLKRIDGVRTVRQIARQGAKDPSTTSTVADGLEFLRLAYLADMIDLRVAR